MHIIAKFLIIIETNKFNLSPCNHETIKCRFYLSLSLSLVSLINLIYLIKTTTTKNEHFLDFNNIFN